MTKQRRHISLKDLARELDISISTVSRALNDHPNISSEVKEKVKRLAEKWDYKPNPLAMGLLRQNTRTIGVIVPDLVTHFFSSVISGIESFARNQGYYIIITSSYESFEKEKKCIENLLNSRVEGLIVSLSFQTSDYSHFEELFHKGIPMVFFDRVCLTDKVPTVVADNRIAARNLTNHFLEMGYRRIAYISGPDFLSISRERCLGYLEGLKDHGITPDLNHIVYCQMEPEEATRATRELLARNPPPDAIFAINDTVAFAAMKEIRKQRLRIPEDIGIIGFTDDYHATVVHPTLTSVTHPTFQMGETAARLILESLNGETEARQVELKTRLVVRESSSRSKAVQG